ncbi:MAG: class I SAM-dependent methyltransferase [Blastocatellia bacterium]
MPDQWNTSLYDQKHAFVTQYGEELLELLNPVPGERVLDIGCGTGHLTSDIAAHGAIVTGIDAAAAMIEAAQKAYPHLNFLQADVTAFTIAKPYDAIFSNAVLHWVFDAEAAVACMARALRPGGRFVVEFGGRGNVQHILSALTLAANELACGPLPQFWYYPSIAEYTGILERHGIDADAAWLFDRPTPLDGADGMLNWLRMFPAVRLSGMTGDTRERLFARAVEKLRATQYIHEVWYADYRRLRIVGHKE